MFGSETLKDSFEEFASRLLNTIVRFVKSAWSRPDSLWHFCFWYHIVLVNITLKPQWPLHTLHLVWAWLLKPFSPVFLLLKSQSKPLAAKPYDEIQACWGWRLLSDFKWDVFISHLHVAGVSLWKLLCSVLFRHPSALWLSMGVTL